MSLENLKLLEGRIDQFLTEHRKVREQRDALGQRLKEKEDECERLSSILKQHEKERAELKARLERILNRLEGLDLG